MDTDIKKWCRECVDCQRSKIHRHTKSLSQHFNLPVCNRFEAVHMDIIGPLPLASPFCSRITRECRYVVTFIDRATRWIEAIPVMDIDAQSVAFAFVNQWVSRFGVPLYLITDRGRQFESELFQKLSNVVGFHRLRTTAYHPQSNGIIERAHRTLKTALKARGGDWIQELPLVLLGLRAIPNEDGLSPFTTVTGTSLLLPSLNSTRGTDIEFVKTLSKQMAELDFSTLSGGRCHGPHQTHIPKDLANAKKVWVRIDRIRRPLEAPYAGPYEVVEMTEKVVTIRKEDGRSEIVSIDRTKPATTTTTRERLPLKPTPKPRSSKRLQTAVQPRKSVNFDEKVTIHPI